MLSIDAKGVGKSADDMYHLREFESLSEMLEYSKKNRDPEASSGSPKSYGYHLSESYDEAFAQAWDGWSDVRPTVDKRVDAIRERLRDYITPHDVRIHDMVGYEPDIDRYVSGEIECMWDDFQIDTPHAGRVFTVLLDNGLTCDQDADEMLRRGASVVALIEAFQVFGFELEVWAETTVKVSGWGDGAERHTTLVRLQRAGDRMDINSIMFPMANPDYHRRLVFGVQEGEPVKIRQAFGFGYQGMGGYGQPRQGCHFGKRVDASIEISLERPDGRMVASPVEWIIGQLAAQGVIRDDD
jgi:hypothetical protein